MEVNLYTISVDAPGDNHGMALQARLMLGSLSRTTFAGECAIIGNRPDFNTGTSRLPILNIPADAGDRVKGARARYSQWLKFLKSGDLPESWFEAGKAILFSDTDCLFLRNPTETVARALRNADVAYVVESGMDVRRPQFASCLTGPEKQALHAAGKHGVNSGCWAVRGEVARRFFQHWKRLHLKGGPTGDQNYYQRMIHLGDGGFRVAQLPPAKYTFPMYTMPRWGRYTKAIHLHFCGLSGCTDKLRAMHGVYQSIQPHRDGTLEAAIRGIEVL